MSLTFLTPLGAVLALAALVPLAVLVATRRRARRVRAGLQLAEPGFRRLLVALASLLGAGALVGLGAAQPVVESQVTHRVRTDAEVFLVLDISRSMLAQGSTGDPMRLERAKTAASAFHAGLPGVRIGIASLTDRVLPHLFPSTRSDVFEATLARAIDVERPPPRSGFQANVTSLDALGAVRGLRFFSPNARKRILVVLTDGESRPVANTRLGTIMRRPPAIETIFVHVWGEDERVFNRGAPEPQYKPDPTSRGALDRLAASTRGAVFDDGSIELATARARALLGEGPTAVEGDTANRLALAPYLTLAAFLPLALLLWRRER